MACRHSLLVFWIVGCGSSGPGGRPVDRESGQTQSTQVPTIAQALPVGVLNGPPDALATEYLPERDFALPKVSDMGFNSRLGINTSRRHLLIGLRADATVAQANEVFALVGGQLAGTIPPVGIVQIELAEGASFETLESTIDALEVHAAVDEITEDLPLSPDAVPEPSHLQWQPSSFTWTWGPPGGSNWGLEEIHAPNAWNLNDAIKRAMEAAGREPPRVAIIDNFKTHGDLAGILTAETFENLLDDDSEHGTFIAGIIGAGWGNGQGIDGIAPFVRIHGVPIPEIRWAWKGEELVSYVSSTLLTNVWSLQALSPRPRVVSISVGFGWNHQCFGGWRCDPRPAAALGRILDSRCDSDLVSRRIEIAGRLMANTISMLNASGDMLFVQSAGNDSGPIANGSWCRNIALSDGMGDFPADLDSPVKWAAVHDGRVRDHMIVVEALELNAGRVRRTEYSNVDGGGVFAPGHRVGSLQSTLLMPPVAIGSGTSYAAPYVAGAAAFLLSIEPTLRDDELRQLLTQTPYARPLDSGQRLLSDTATELDLFGAALGIDRIRPSRRPTVRQWLADFDDGTADGVRRVIYNDSDLVSGLDVSDVRGDGKVDMRDFRRFRDAYLQATATPSDAFGLDGGEDHPKRDLNFDTEETPEIEHFPRAALNGDPLLNDTPAPYLDESLTDLAVLASVYETDAVQPWPSAALPGLRYSADLIVRAEAIRIALGATAITVSIEGDERNTYSAPLPTDLAPLRDITIAAETEETILTTPLLREAKLKWRPIYDDGPGEYEFVQTLPNLRPGEDRLVVLACPTIAVETIVGGLASRSCSGSSFLGCCMTCDWCDGTALLGVTGDETVDACRGDADNCPYDFDWSCDSPPCNFGIDDSEATSRLSFSQWLAPSCWTSASSEISVAVEIAGCAPSRVETTVPFDCLTTQLSCY